jgi:hypothetical protein
MSKAEQLAPCSRDWRRVLGGAKGTGSVSRQCRPLYLSDRRHAKQAGWIVSRNRHTAQHDFFDKRRGSKVFFFEKKKQKTFGHWLRLFRIGSAQTRKSFLVLFFKKERLTNELPTPATAKSKPP